MNAIDRFKHLRKQLRKKIGVGSTSSEVELHLSHAASIQQVLEVSRHEILLGRQLDSATLAALRDQLSIELMQAAIAASSPTTRYSTQGG